MATLEVFRIVRNTAKVTPLVTDTPTTIAENGRFSVQVSEGGFNYRLELSTDEAKAFAVFINERTT